jgi:hypothetical protein
MSQVRVSGNASGTGILTVTSPNTNSNYTLTLPAQTGTILTNASTTGFPAGSVLQVVQATSTTTQSTTSSTMVSTGIGATITPTSATSKVLVFIQTSITSTANGGSGLSIARSSTVVWNPCVSDGSGFYGAFLNINTTRTLSCLQYLDSPATTSATTYNLYFASRSGTTTVVNPTDSTSGGTSIILMEIAA